MPTAECVTSTGVPVSAYPAITIISNRPQGEAIAADTTHAFGAAPAKAVLSGAAASPARLAMLEHLNDRFRPLEDDATGTRVGIGVATGADKVFVVRGEDNADVEEDRLLPRPWCGTPRAVSSTGGTYLVNPWSAAGELVDLAHYPRLARYFRRNGADLRERYVAIRQSDRWHKTIDKVDHRLTGPKLFLPDMKLTIHPALDEGGLYPHHNLYFIVSDGWDLRVLGGLLLSKVAEAFVSAYAVKMRGGTLRFQAQYLRKIRVPDPAAINGNVRAALAEAFGRRDVQAATIAAVRAYGITEIKDKVGVGTAGSVRGGKHFDGIAALIAKFFVEAGYPAGDIRVTKRQRLELPGYYRPQKQWDLIVAQEGTLVAAFELKSLGGPSFGNDDNNRGDGRGSRRPVRINARIAFRKELGPPKPSGSIT